jgi:hypothetical protein
MESFTLTFSVGYGVNNPEELMIQWTEDVAYQVLEESIDPNCTRELNILCPLTLQVTVFLFERDCSFFPSLEGDTCALTDLTVALSSKESFDETVLVSINNNIRDRINELEIILQ